MKRHSIDGRWRLYGGLGTHAVLCAAATLLQGAEGAGPDKSGFDLLHPTPRSMMRELSTDRPDTTESPFTVDAGHFQVEISLVDYARDRDDAAGMHVEALAIAPMLLKVGVLNWMDVQVGFDPYTRVEAEDLTTGATLRAQGFGDTVVRMKANLWGNDGGETALALMPFVSLPSGANGLTSDRVDWGFMVPFAASLPGGFGLGLMAEFDFGQDAASGRETIEFVHTATVGCDVADDVGAYIEYAGFAEVHHQSDYRAYFDAGVTYGLSEDVQLDAGVRVGLTDAAEDVGVFVGLSRRF